MSDERGSRGAAAARQPSAALDAEPGAIATPGRAAPGRTQGAALLQEGARSPERSAPGGVQRARPLQEGVGTTASAGEASGQRSYSSRITRHSSLLLSVALLVALLAGWEAFVRLRGLS